MSTTATEKRKRRPRSPSRPAHIRAAEKVTAWMMRILEGEPVLDKDGQPTKDHRGRIRKVPPSASHINAVRDWIREQDEKATAAANGGGNGLRPLTLEDAAKRQFENGFVPPQRRPVVAIDPLHEAANKRVAASGRATA